MTVQQSPDTNEFFQVTLLISILAFGLFVMGCFIAYFAWLGNCLV